MRGAKWGANVPRRNALQSHVEHPEYAPDLVSSDNEQRAAITGISFASRGSGVQIPSAPLGIAGQGDFVDWLQLLKIVRP